MTIHTCVTAIVIQQVKLSSEMLASCLPAALPIQLPAGMPGNAAPDGLCTLHPGNLNEVPGHSDHLGSKPVVEVLSPCLCLPLPFKQVNQSFKQ